MLAKVQLILLVRSMYFDQISTCTNLFGRTSYWLLKTQVHLKLVIILTGEAYLPIYIAHCVADTIYQASPANSWFLLVHKKHYKREMFCKIKISRYFIPFISVSRTLLSDLCYAIIVLSVNSTDLRAQCSQFPCTFQK